MTELKLTRDFKGVVSYGINFSDTGSAINMPANTDETLAVPAGADFALFQIQPGATVYIGDSAITPPTSSFGAFTADINPAGRSLYNISTLHFHSVDAAIVKVSFYKVNN
tara:strand:+ start:14368 stop:14697 length:330 start_codon:yes stop_codon:yes gene_type:complete